MFASTGSTKRTVLMRVISCVPRNFGRAGGGGQQIQLRTENGDLGSVAPYPLVKGSGGSCNLVQEISFHIAKVS